MFDPPEYVNWKPDPGIIAEFEQTLTRDSQRASIISELTEKQLLDMYAGLLRFRLHDITLRRWVKQGVIAKAWLATGEEAVTIGNVHVPAIYVLQNNQIALGTRFEQHQAGPFTAWAKAYGVTGLSCAGNNVLDTYAATKLAAQLARTGHGPVIIFAETFRMGGHVTHDENDARQIISNTMFEYWGKRDPIGMYESYLERHGVPKTNLEQAEAKVIEEIARAEKEALESRDRKMP